MRRLCLKHRHLERMIPKLNALEMLELVGTDIFRLLSSGRLKCWNNLN